MTLKHFVKSLTTMLCLLLSVGVSFAQTMSVKGRVIDESGAGIIAAGVQVKGTTAGVVTDLNGEFQMNVDKGVTLVFSCIGYLPVELQVSPDMTVTLKEDSQTLEETVVVGYGVQRKSDVTGSISKVGADDIKDRSVTTVQQALQGKTAGVQILSSSAAPGSSQTVRIRGFSSNYSSDPLYVVDGLRVSDISAIDPNDIQSMEVLKDAASAAIYGAEAGNGVVLITTKHAEQGTSSINYDFQFTSQSLSNLPDVLNAKQYMNWVLEGGWHDQAYFDNFYDGVTDTDWTKEAFENSISQKHSLSFQKSTGKTNLYISASFLSDNGIIKGDDDTFNRITATANIDTDIKPWLKIGINSSIGYTKQVSIAESGFLDNGEVTPGGSVIASALYMDPLTPVSVSPDKITTTMANALANGKTLLKNGNGDYWGLSDFSQVVNPFIYRNAYSFTRKRIDYRGTYYLTVTPVKGLDITSRLGVQLSAGYHHNLGKIFYAANSGESENTTTMLGTNSILGLYYQWENFANYTKTIGRHTFGGMVGVSFSDYNRNTDGASANAVQKNSSRYYYLDYATNDAAKTVSGTEASKRKYSYFGRLNYSYADRYMAQVSFRADAADLSVLPADNRWGYFPSFSLGWVTSKEPWFPKSDKLTYTKVRGSWGQNGSIANLTNYMWNSSIASDISYPFGNTPVYNVGSTPTTLGNHKLKWETSEQVDLGLDMRFFNDKLSFSVDYYKKKTKDLIVSGVTPSLTAGNSPSPINAGNVENSGFEFEASYKGNIGDFSYTVSGNIATIKNKVTYLDPTIHRLAGFWANGNSYMTTFEKGYPVWYFRGYKYLGVDPQTGDPTFVDVDKNGSYDDADMMKIGSAIPDFTYGVTINLAYKNFDLVVFGTGSQGNDIYSYQSVNSAGRNKLKYYYDGRWTESNHNSKFPRPNSTYDNQFFNSSGVIFDGSYFKIKQIQLGYTIPEKVLKVTRLRSARAYISLDDFFTFTDYPGFDPEVASTGYAYTNGVDSGSYPTAKKFVFGLNITF